MANTEIELEEDLQPWRIGGEAEVPATTDASVTPPAPASPVIPVIIIKPSRGWVSLKLSELWEYRALIFFLTWRDIKVRYKQTALGAAWAIIPTALKPRPANDRELRSAYSTVSSTRAEMTLVVCTGMICAVRSLDLSY